MRVRWSKAALADLNEIRRYIKQYNPTAAGKVVAKIRKVRDLLRRHPLAGHGGRVAGTREIVVADYYVVVHVVDDVVEIAAVIDGRNRP